MNELDKIFTIPFQEHEAFEDVTAKLIRYHSEPGRFVATIHDVKGKYLVVVNGDAVEGLFDSFKEAQRVYDGLTDCNVRDMDNE